MAIINLISIIILNTNNMNQAVKPRNLQQDLQKVRCYLGNVDELIQEIETKFIDPNTGQLVDIDIKVAIEMANELISKFVETASECEGKQIGIEWPEGIAWTILRTILASIGLNLPIK